MALENMPLIQGSTVLSNGQKSMVTQPAGPQLPGNAPGSDTLSPAFAASLASGQPTNLSSGGGDGTVRQATIPTPAVVSSGNAQTKTDNNTATYNNIQTGITGASTQFDPTTGKTWNSATGDYSGPVSSKFTPPAGSTPTTPPSGMKGVTVNTNADGSTTYTADDPTNTSAVAYAQLQNQNASYSAAVSPLIAKVASLANGTYVLTPAEQGQLDNIQTTINQAVDAQTKANNMELGANNAWAGSVGADRYGGNSNDLFRGDLVTRETARITDIQIKGATAIAAAKQAILDGDSKRLNDAITQYQNYNKQNSDNITNLLKISSDAAAQAHQVLQDKIDQQKLQLDQTKDMATFIRNNATGTKPYVIFGGTVFDTQGNIIQPSQFAEKGINQSNVEPVSDQTANSTTDTKNYNEYKTELTAAGGKPVLFGDWLTAQKRAGASTTVIQPNSTKAIDNVKAIISAHPNDWQGASTAINQELGNPNAATLYDPLLKQEYQLPADAQNFGTYVTQQIKTGSKWDQQAYDQGYEKFKEQTPYLTDDGTRRKAYDAAVPKPKAGRAL